MFRFTIRDVLWLLVVVGLGVGWWQHNEAHRAALWNYESMIDEVNSSGIWHDKDGRILQFGLDARGRYKVVPFEKDERGIWGPVATP
jgi:hypothetical protein